MRKILLAITVLTAIVSGPAAAGSKYSSSSTITYNGISYKYSSTSTCSDGTAALRLYRKWWCPATTTTVISPAPTPTEPAPAPTEPALPVVRSANLAWVTPATRADGTPLSTSELAGYEIYYTNDSGSVNVSVPVAGGNTVSAVVGNLTSGTYHFSLSAIDTSGLKSALSTVASVTIP